MFKLKIITPEKIVYENYARFIEFRTVNGGMGTLQNRAPLLVGLAIFELEVEDENGSKRSFAIHGGIGEFSNNTFTIISDAAERAEDVDAERAKKALEKARTDLESVEDIVKRKQLEAKIEKALLRLKIVQKKGRK